MAFKYIAVASSLHDSCAVSSMLREWDLALERIGGIKTDADDAHGDPAAFLFLQTGGVESEVVRRLRSLEQQGKSVPALLIAHPAHNSLPAALEILARVRQEGGQGRIYLLRDSNDVHTLGKIAQTARCLAANAKLAEDRLGLVGESSDWLVASSHRADIVSTRFGMKVLPLEIAEWRARIAQDPAPAQGPEYAAWTNAEIAQGLTMESYSRAVGVYRGLLDLVRTYRLSAVTVRCFDLVDRDSTTGCLALSRLADEGISAGCEGDVPSVVALRWLWHLMGNAGWMANPSDVNAQTGELMLAHCTVPLGMVESHRLKTHFESGKGVGIDGTFRPGPVTLLRLGGANLDQWWGAEGHLLDNRHGENLCRTQARVQIPPHKAAELLDAPLGNHLVMAMGHISSLFSEAFDLVGT